MKLIQDIKSDATDSSKNLADVLRKTRIVASLLKNPELKEWVNRELKGYYGIDEKEIPKYRKAVGQNLGHFSGPFNSGLRNANIPPSTLPDWIKELVSEVVYRQSVGELKSLAESESGTFQAKWPADLVAYVQHNTTIYQNMHLVDAWQVMTKGQVTGILDTVRTRLLDFILELEESFPDLVETEKDLKRIPPQEVTNHFHNHISGNNNIVASGSNFKQEIGEIVVQNDFKSLENYLNDIGIPDSETKDLEVAILKDDKPSSVKNLGKNVSKWLGKITEKAVSGSIEVASKEGTMAIVKAIASYYGLDTTS